MAKYEFFERRYFPSRRLNVRHYVIMKQFEKTQLQVLITITDTSLILIDWIGTWSSSAPALWRDPLAQDPVVNLETLKRRPLPTGKFLYDSQKIRINLENLWGDLSIQLKVQQRVKDKSATQNTCIETKIVKPSLQAQT